MKKITLSLITLGLAGLLVTAVAQDNSGGNPNDPNAPGTPETPVPPGFGFGPVIVVPPPGLQGGEPPDLSNLPPPGFAPGEDNSNNTTTKPMIILPSRSQAAPVVTIEPTFLPPVQASGTNQNDIDMNIRNAPLEMVLNYLSDAAGFIIVQRARVNGSVTIKGSHVTKDEAVDLLNAELNKNGYAAIRNGRVLTILDKNDAKTSNIPVKSGNIPGQIPNNAEIVTQIIPIRFVDARQLVSDLTSFVSPQATVVANEAGNSVVITDTQANIRHIMEIIKAIDDSAEAETEIRVFHLQHANPSEVAAELSSVFPNSTSGSGGQAPTRFGGSSGRSGRSSFFAAMMGGGSGGGGGGGSSSSDRVKKATQVTAVADARIQAVIVTAPKDLMVQIEGMMNDLDVASDRDPNVTVIPLVSGDPNQVAQVLQGMFGSSTSSRGGGSSSGSSANSMLQERAQNASSTMGNTTTTSGIGGAGAAGGGSRGGSRGAQF